VRALARMKQILNGGRSRAPSALAPDSTFRCNLCGVQSTSPIELTRMREEVSCESCGSTLRLRTLVSAISNFVYGESRVLEECPPRPDISGVGLSDHRGLAALLENKFNYTNTFFHKNPKLDIADCANSGYRELDFIVSSDVFEHVAPPVARAFVNARRLLRSGGKLFFSVPYVPSGETVEHYPELFEFTIEDSGKSYVLHNRTRDGRTQTFENLIFHGGPGTTLEMRLFALPDLREQFTAAGFREPRLLDDHLPQFGIDWNGEHCSIPMVAEAC
jgi:SAM-dependent methyltransferase